MVRKRGGKVLGDVIDENEGCCCCWRGDVCEGRRNEREGGGRVERWGWRGIRWQGWGENREERYRKVKGQVGGR